MDGVGTPIIGRPRPLPRHDTPNPAYHPHTLNYEEPVCPKPPCLRASIAAQRTTSQSDRVVGVACSSLPARVAWHI